MQEPDQALSGVVGVHLHTGVYRHCWRRGPVSSSSHDSRVTVGIGPSGMRPTLIDGLLIRGINWGLPLTEVGEVGVDCVRPHIA